MPKSSSSAAAIVNILLMPLGAVCVAAGVVGASRDAELRWLYVVLALAGAVVLFGAAHALFAWGHAVRVDEATERAMVEAVRAEPDASSGLAGPVLVHWTYAPDEWRRYVSHELAYRTREALGMGAATLVIGTLVIGVLEGGEWKTGAVVSGVVAGFIALGRWLVALSGWRRNRAVAAGDVIIGTHAILVNRRYGVIHDRNVRFAGAKVLEGEQPAILEVTIMVPGKYRRSPEEYRIPIPAGHLEEAHAVARELTGTHSAQSLVPSP